MIQPLQNNVDEMFIHFLQDIPAEYQRFVLELDEYLTVQGSKRTIKAAKSGFVTSYSSPASGRALLNYVFRKSGVKMRIYAEHMGEHPNVLNCLPDNMKSDIKKAGDCKKLTGFACTPTCPGGYTFVMDGEEYRKCKNMAFFHSLTAGNMEHILKLIKAEIEHEC